MDWILPAAGKVPKTKEYSETLIEKKQGQIQMRVKQITIYMLYI